MRSSFSLFFTREVFHIWCVVIGADYFFWLSTLVTSHIPPCMPYFFLSIFHHWRPPEAPCSPLTSTPAPKIISCEEISGSFRKSLALPPGWEPLVAPTTAGRRIFWVWVSPPSLLFYFWWVPSGALSSCIFLPSWIHSPFRPCVYPGQPSGTSN